LVLGLIIGSVIAFVLENIDTTIDTIEGIESFIELPVLGVIPFIFLEDENEKFRFFKRIFGSKSSKKDDMKYFQSLVVLHKKNQSALESYHTLHTNISYALSNSKIKTILFTSAGPGEGKTLTAANYALAAAQSGLKTILIESDLRQPILHRIFGISKENGLTDVVSGKIKWQDAVKSTTDFLMGKMSIDKILETSGIENFKVITSGIHTANPVDIMSSENINLMMRELKAEFDLIIFDAPPLLLFADGFILSRNMDGIIIVYRVGRTSKSSLNRAKSQLDNIKAHIIGVVLNGLKPSELEPRYGYYYSRYRNK
jgi:tyrosine-protein kinase Etk/Wzc